MGKDRTLEIIKTEIERRITDNTFGAKLELIDILAWLDTLESEHLADASKTSPKDLEKAADEYEKKHTYQRYDGGGLTPEYDATLAEAVIFGAKWQKEQDEKELSKKIAAAYQLGIADKEKQMMKNAKDGWIDEECVIVLNDGTRIDLQPDYDKKPAFEFEYAQDVRVIVLPKEDNYDARRKE